MLAIDPGTICGVAFSTSDARALDLRLLKAAPKKRRPQDRYEARCGKLWVALCDLDPQDIVVVEGAAAFQRGKAAVRVSHELRGVVQAWCHVTAAKYHEVQPGDLKRWVTGKTTADKSEMIAAAHAQYGYDGDDDNVADAILLFAWAEKFLNERHHYDGTDNP